MNMELVDSSSIARVGYDEGTQDLKVQFQSGWEYLYADVPEAVFDDFINAESVGRFLNEKIKPKYAVTPVEYY